MQKWKITSDGTPENTHIFCDDNEIFVRRIDLSVTLERVRVTLEIPTNGVDLVLEGLVQKEE